MLNELLPTDLVNGDGTIKPEAQATILSGTKTSNNGFSPLQQAQQEVSMNLMDYLNRKAPGSSYAALSSTKLKQRDDADEYNQKLIKRRNTGIGALMKIPSSKRAKAYPKLIEMLRGQGADVGMPEQYDEEALSLMKGEEDGDNWAAKLALQHKYRMEELMAKGQGEDELTKVMKREQAKKIVDTQKTLSEEESAYNDFLNNKEYLKKLADEAKTGFGAGIGTSYRRMMTKDNERNPVLDSRSALKSSLNNFVLSNAQKMKGNLSDKDIKFLEEMVGNETMTPGEIKSNLDVIDKMFAGAAAKSKQKLSSMYDYAGINKKPSNNKTTTGKTDYKSKYGLD